MASQPTLPDPLGFAKRMWGNLGVSFPGMVTPTLDPEEIQKKINDLKAVENWLKMNLSMLQMTIQGMEMQCVTLNAMRAMGQMANTYGSGASAGEGGETPTSDGLRQAAMWPWALLQQMQDNIQQVAAATKAGQSGDENKSEPAR